MLAGQRRFPALPPPAADGWGLWCRCWCPAPRQSDYRSMPRRPSRRRPSAGYVPSVADGLRLCPSGSARRADYAPSAVSLTMYFLTAGCCAVTTHLRNCRRDRFRDRPQYQRRGVLSCSPCQVVGRTTSCLFSKLFSMAAVGQSRRHDHETTADHALMRELVIAGPVMRRGASSV